MTLRIPPVSIRLLLFGANAVALLAPLLVLLGFELYDVVLMRDTEERLIAQAVVIGETWRIAFEEESGRTIRSFTRPGQTKKYAPWEASIDLSTPVGGPLVRTAQRTASLRDSPESRAGKRIETMLERSRRFNLSGARILDRRGCVVATSSTGVEYDRGACMPDVPEVAKALRGEYGVSARTRTLHHPLPPLDGLSRRSRVQIFVAIPLFVDGDVIGVVRMARTSVSTLEYLWKNRRGLLIFLGISVLFVFASSMLSYRVIARPVWNIAEKARSIASGTPRGPLTPTGFVPREIHELSQSLDQMTDQLSARAEYTAKFVTHATHELRTPITAISGAAELLADSWQVMSDEQRTRFIQNIEIDARRMERLVTRLLTLARVENPGASSDGPRISVREFFEGMRAYYEQVEFHFEAAPLAIAIGEDHLASVVRNLIENALRHGRHVRVDVVDEAGRLRIDVTDDGPGVSEPHRDRMFERFYTTERDRGGTGLGLAIVKAIAEGREGRVEYARVEEKTRFRVIL